MAFTDLEALRYIASHSDLTQLLGANPDAGRSHFELAGRSEGRTITFDPVRYVASFPDLIRSIGLDQEAATREFITTGFARGRAPTFDTLSYIASHADLSSVFGLDTARAAAHYVQTGFFEGRTITFDPLIYIASHSDLIQTFGADRERGATHFILAGRSEGRTTTTFDPTNYLAANVDLISAFGFNASRAVDHYIRVGFAEGRSTRFDGLSYIASSPDLIRTFGLDAEAGTRHFVVAGFNEGRRITFDGRLYLASHADLLRTFGPDQASATAHFINTGFAEGRTINFDPVGYLLSQSDLRSLGFGPDRALQHWVGFGFAEGRSDAQFGREQTNHAVPLGGGVVADSFQSATDFDWFQTQLTQGQQARFTVSIGAPSARAQVSLHDSGGRVITTVTATGPSVTLDYSATATGLFYLSVSDAAGAAAGYTVQAATFRFARTGASGADEITGTTGNDSIQGLDGNDTLIGRIGDDVIEGGRGDDVLDGGVGDDTLFGFVTAGGSIGGRDILTDSAGGNDQLFGQDDDDIITVVRTGRAPISTSLLLDGGNGEDVIRFTSDRVTDLITINGGDGSDTISLGDFATGTIDAGIGNDLVMFATRGGVQNITLGSGLDMLMPNLTGGSFTPAAAVRVTDLRNERILLDEYFLQTFVGWDGVSNPFGAGFARVVARGSDSVLQVDRDGGGDSYADLITLNRRSLTSLSSLEFGWNQSGAPTPGVLTVGGDGGDRLLGQNGDDTINGLLGADTIDGRAGNDFVQGGAGADSIEGGLGNDTLFGNDQLDTTGDGSGDLLTDSLGGSDQLFGQGGADVLRVTRLGNALVGTVLLDGGADNDQITFASDRLADVVTAVGGGGDDVIAVGPAAQVTVDAGAGADRVTLNGRSGAQTVTLGAGADLLALERAGATQPLGGPIRVTDFTLTDRVSVDSYLLDSLQGWDQRSNPFGTFLFLAQSGADAVLSIDRDGSGPLAAAPLILFEGLAAASLTADQLGYAPVGGAPAGRSVGGTPGSDTLIGFNGPDTLSGLDGTDVLDGLSGNDVLEGGLGADTLDGGLGADTLYGNNTANGFLFDGSGDVLRDTLGGDDQLFGQDGSDTITVTRQGVTAASTVLLDGGTGNDTLSFDGNGRFADFATLRGGADNDVIAATTAGRTVIEAGSGNDRVIVSTLGGVVDVALGTGSDTLTLEIPPRAVGPFSDIRVSDFAFGADRVAIDDYLQQVLTGWNPATNPFAGGFLRMVQSGSDSLLQIDFDGSAGPVGFATLITFQNTSVATFGRNELGFAQDGSLGIPGVNSGPGGTSFSSGLGSSLDELRTEPAFFA